MDHLTPRIPNIPNSHAVLEQIARQQIAAHKELLAEVSKIADSIQKQEQILRALLTLQESKG